MLGKHIKTAGREHLAVARSIKHRLLRCHRLKKFKPVARHQNGATGLVQPVIGAADALQQARGSLGRTHLHHAVHIAPVNP